MKKIPFNRPFLVGKEFEYMRSSLNAGTIAGDGSYTRRCHELLETELGVDKVLLTTSCTHALEMAAILLNVGPGDEVIIPSFTFVSTANAFVLRGAKPVFADIRADTLNIDESILPDLITERTKAIVVVHYAGVGCEMDRIMEIARAHSIPVVEDNAHGLFGRYRDQYLGTFGCLATQSFHETKNIQCGEGGALLINDETLVARAEIIREKGTNRSRFFRGEIDKYTWVDVGSSFLPSDLLAAFLYAQLEARLAIQQSRSSLWYHYQDNLTAWAAANAVQLPTVSGCCDQAFHMFYMLLPSIGTREALIAHLRERKIQAVFHYVPLHLSTMGRGFGGKSGDCPITEDISDRLLRLPFYNDMSDRDRARVVESLLNFDFN